MKIKTGLPFLIAALLLSACAARSAATVSPQMAPAPDISGSKAMDQAAAGDYYAREEPAAESMTYSGNGSNANAVERLVIKNANLAIMVVDPMQSLAAISAMADEMSGYVVTSYSYKTTLGDGKEVPEASITLRVPAEKLNDALDQIKAQVRNPDQDVLSENVSGQDVTQEYTDLQSRLRNQEDAEKQLREIMASATKTEDVLNTFNQLTAIREQIEVLKGQIQYYEESAALSSISVNIKAEESVQPLAIGGWQPVGVARNAIQALINAFKFLVNALIWLILFALPIFLVIYLPIRLLWGLFRKWRNNRKAKKSANTPPSATIPPAGS